jgi:hypothetical protein
VIEWERGKGRGPISAHTVVDSKDSLHRKTACSSSSGSIVWASLVSLADFYSVALGGVSWNHDAGRVRRVERARNKKRSIRLTICDNETCSAKERSRGNGVREARYSGGLWWWMRRERWLKCGERTCNEKVFSKGIRAKEKKRRRLGFALGWEICGLVISVIHSLCGQWLAGEGPESTCLDCASNTQLPIKSSWHGVIMGLITCTCVCT